MYVRLKHALSALALDALRGPHRRAASSAVAWLKAFCDLSTRAVGEGAVGTGASSTVASLEAPLERVARAVSARGARRASSRRAQIPRRILTDGLLERRGKMLALPTGVQPFLPYFTRQIHRLDVVLRTPASRARGRGAAVRRGAALFDGGLFFECHEFFEEIWRRAPASEKGFYQGIILVAAAFYHVEKGNVHGARTKLAAGVERLRSYLPGARGVRIDRWLPLLASWQARIESGQTGVMQTSEIPRIPFTVVKPS